MKKIFLGLGIVSASLFAAQYYPNDGWGNNSYGNSGYYGDRDDQYYFPDDYYYEYPNDYYSDDYYRSFYDDYRRSISMINWQRFFMDYHLTRWQINMIMDLNRQFDSYYAWDSYYRMNPNRWYYDRFFALERILGPKIFIVFQNYYYDGYSPVAYYTNRWNTYYRPMYRVMPRYRTVNINIYKVNRNDYHRSVGTNYGWNQPRNSHNPGGFKEDNNRKNGSFKNQSDSGFRVQNQNENFRSNENSGKRVFTPKTDSGFRTPAQNTSRTEPRTNSGMRNTAEGGFRNGEKNASQRNSPNGENSGSRNYTRGTR